MISNVLIFIVLLAICLHRNSPLAVNYDHQRAESICAKSVKQFLWRNALTQTILRDAIHDTLDVSF